MRNARDAIFNYCNVGVPPRPTASHGVPRRPARRHAQVQWEGSLQGMVRAGKSKLYEMGPGQQIKAMVKRVDPAAWKEFVNVGC